MTLLLEVLDLSVLFDIDKQNLHAVRNASFKLFESEIVGVVGESGSGKSSIGKALTRLLPKQRCSIHGKALYKNRDLLSQTEKEMQRIRGKEIGMIFQDPLTSLNPTMKIGIQIIEGYLRHHPTATFAEAKQRALEVLHLVGIPQPVERFHDYPHTLSGGTRQRIMIAIALISTPSLIIADEPTTSLDVTVQAQILDLLQQIRQKTGTAILLITHDLSLVAGFCDRVLVMYGGAIVESGSVEAVFAHPSHPYTRRLLESIPRPDQSSEESLVPIEGTAPILFSHPIGCSFCPRCTSSMQICRKQQPPLLKLNDAQESACWLYDPRRASQ